VTVSGPAVQPAWNDPAFIEQAETWIRGQVAVTGPIEQVHVQWWSTVFRIPTAESPVWFKATAPEERYEVALTAFLAAGHPDLVPIPFASDPDAGWMILADGGVPLRDSGESIADWEAILPRYAELQLAVAPAAGRLLLVGVPEEDLAGIPDRLERLLDSDEFLLLDRPEGLPRRDRGRLRAMIPKVREMCAELASLGIPETIQHDDLHGGAILVRDGVHRVFDWGDSSLSHSFHSLTVLLRATAWKLGLEPGGPELVRMRDAYLEPFTAHAPRDRLIEAADIAYQTGTLGRARAWHRYLAARPPEARGDDLESIPYGLLRFLEGGPIGSWR
jgi:hypothetical protein